MSVHDREHAWEPSFRIVRLAPGEHRATVRPGEHRSYLADGRVVILQPPPTARSRTSRTRAWYPDEFDVIGPGVGGDSLGFDAEMTSRPVPPALARRYGADEQFWRSWTAAEAIAKLLDVPILAFLDRHGLEAVRPPVPGSGVDRRAHVTPRAKDATSGGYGVRLAGERILVHHWAPADDVVAATAQFLRSTWTA